MEYKTEQENFWAGEFGDEYISRNNDSAWIAYRMALFAKIISFTNGIDHVLELGSNIGQNIVAIKNILPNADFTAVEINPTAAAVVEKMDRVNVINGSFLDIPSDKIGIEKYDLTFTAGVLIHISPDRLDEAYQRLYDCSKKYIVVSEYYSPTPQEISYRGHSDKMYKRDFAGDLMDKYPDLELITYGFQYRRDNNFIADDVNWFLMRKS